MKLSDVFKKNNLDEMQEQKLLHIEKQGFWLLFGLIALDLIVKCILNGSRKEMLSETLCFIIAGSFVVWRCLKNGIWDRRLKANFRTNAVISLIGAVAAAAANVPLFYQNAGGRFCAGVLAAAAFSGVLTFILAFLILNVCTAAYKKKVNQLENQEEEEDD